MILRPRKRRAAVIRAILDSERDAFYPLDICPSGVGAGTLYPLLAEMEQRGWLTSDWEEDEPENALKAKGGNRRRMYRIVKREPLVAELILNG